MKKVLYLSIFINILVISFVSKQIFALNVSKDIQDLVWYVQSMIFTDNGTPDWNIKVRISWADWWIYASGWIWLGKWSGNSIYSNGINVWIWTTDLTNKLNVWGNIKLQDWFALKVWNGSSYIQWNGLNMSIVWWWDIGIDGYINLAKTSSWMPYTNGYNYIRGGTIAYGSTWYDESDNNYYIDPNVWTKVNWFSANSVWVGTISPNAWVHIYSPTGNNAEIDIQSVAWTNKHWAIYQDRNTEKLNIWNWTNRLSLSNTGLLDITWKISTNDWLCIKWKCITSWDEVWWWAGWWAWVVTLPAETSLWGTTTHNAWDCLAAGWVVFNIWDGTYVCKVTWASCPAWWSPYSNWTSTTASGCGNNTFYGWTSCGTTRHGFADLSRESCQYSTCSSGKNISCRAATCWAGITEIWCK